MSKELEMVNTLAEKLPSGLVTLLGRTVAGPVYYRFLSDYRGRVTVGDETLELAGETHWEYMVMNLRCGQVPRPAPRMPM